MMLVWLLAVAVGVSGRASLRPGSCQVSDWGPWSEWNYRNHDKSVTSFPVTEKTNEGTQRRLAMMKVKTEQAAKRRQCKADGSCPELMNRKTEGFVPCEGGIADSTISSWACDLVDQQSFVPIEEMGFNAGFDSSPDMNDVWGWVDPDTQDEYAIAGLTSGTSFIRVTNPTAPEVLGHLQTHSGSSGTTWRDMKVIGNYVYIVSEHGSHGVQVFDLTRLRGLDAISPGVPRLFEPDAHYPGSSSCHNIVANEETGFVYLVGCADCSGGLHIVDVNDPLNPSFAGCFSGDGYVHDAQCVIYNGPHLGHQGKEICFCYNENTLTVVDVTNKESMQMLSRTGYSGAWYTHQGWVTDDQRTILLDDELDEMNGNGIQKTYIWDIYNLEEPQVMNVYNSGIRSADHNQYIIGDLTYQTNYEMGLRILNIDTDNYLLNPVAFFDVYPGNNAAEFNGAWSNYPYFPSGNIIVTSIQYGLFVLRPNMTEIRARIDEIKAREVYMERKRYREILSADDEFTCPSLMDIEYS